MAESIIIHFGDHEESQIAECLDSSFDRHDDSPKWYHPKNDYLVMIMPYEDFDSEYEDEDKQIIRAKLGRFPLHSFDFEIRRSKSDQACDLLEQFVRTKLGGFAFVVDDMFTCYSPDEIKNADDFLDRYRYKKK